MSKDIADLKGKIIKRARDLGIPLNGVPGPLNAITDVLNVSVGHVTLIGGDGPRKAGLGPVRTGVTAVMPRGLGSTDPVFAGWSTLNSSGEMTGTIWLDERGFFDGPILLTNTHSVGVVRDTVIGWMVDEGWTSPWFSPIVAETYDGFLNDINGFHVRPNHVLDAIQTARGGYVMEGSVGGGTGMICHHFKGGIGTSSRQVYAGGSDWTVGVLVQSNYGKREPLRVAGVPIGQILKDRYLPRRGDGSIGLSSPYGHNAAVRDGSIIVIVATDAPLLPHQLKRVSKRPNLALGRLGSIGSGGSGDIFLAFSTAQNGLASVEEGRVAVEMLGNEALDPIFEATIDATEEAILNSMVAANDMMGADNLKVFGFPNDEVMALMEEWYPPAGRTS